MNLSDHTNMQTIEVGGLSFLPKFKMAVPIEDASFPGGNVQKTIKETGHWAPEESFVMSQVLKQSPKGTVIDVGANTGYFSLIALSLGHDVVAIEANSVHKQYVDESLRVNNFESRRCRYIEAFVSDNDSPVLFDGWTGHDGILTEKNAKMIDTVAIRDLASECVFMKVDVEGAEPDVLRSAQPYLKAGKFPYIMFEITYIINKKLDQCQVDMLYDLTKAGFNIYEIVPGILRHIPNIDVQVDYWVHEYINTHLKADPTLRFAGTNLVAIHNSVKDVPFEKTAYGYALRMH
jgi:FkbM family methyltransferase